MEAVAFTLGGAAGQRLVRNLPLAANGASRNTQLRLVRRAVLPAADEIAPQLRAVGVDDFAFRRGVRYGALLVDLEQHRVLDRLPYREAATLARWLKRHAGEQVEVVSRDRGGAFADGVRQAAPEVTQVADRFHLLQNLGQALDRLLTREHRVLTRVAEAVEAVEIVGAVPQAPIAVAPDTPVTAPTGRQDTAVAGRAPDEDAAPTLAPLPTPPTRPPGPRFTRVEREPCPDWRRAARRPTLHAHRARTRRG